jgi:hypothetical protein
MFDILNIRTNLSELKGSIVDEDMEPVTLKEDFSTYELSNGLLMSVKAVAGQIGKTKHYNPDGEPVYLVNVAPINNSSFFKT